MPASRRTPRRFRQRSRSARSRSGSTACVRPGLKHLNMNIGRTMRLPGNKTLQFRVDALNVFNNETYATPNLNPTSTQFGMITANNGTYMRFVTFVTKFNF